MIGDLFGVGDSIRGAWAEVMGFFDSINLFESGAKLMATFADGIKSLAMAPMEAVTGALTWVRNLLPFSDAKTGPLSTLTLSGTRMMTTLGEGVNAGAPTLLARVSGAVDSVKDTLAGWWSGLTGGEVKIPAPVMPEMPNIGPVEPVNLQATVSSVPATALPPPVNAVPANVAPLNMTLPNVALPDMNIPRVPLPSMDIPDTDIPYERRHADGGMSGKGDTTTYITITNLNLPGVSDAKSFESDMQRWVGEYNGASA